MIVASAAAISGTPPMATWPSPVGTASSWKLSTSPCGSEAAQTTTPPSSSSRPAPTPPCAPQPSSTASPPSRSRTASTPSSTWSRFGVPANTITRSGRAPPRPSCARDAASAKASTPPSSAASPVAIRALIYAMLASGDPQLALVGRRARVLTDELAEAARRAGRVAAAVVVELHVDGGGLLGHPLHARGDLAQLVVAVLPAEALGHALALQVALGVAAVHADVGEIRAGDRVHVGHDRDVDLLRGVHGDEGGVVVRQPV